MRLDPFVGEAPEEDDGNAEDWVNYFIDDGPKIRASTALDTRDSASWLKWKLNHPYVPHPRTKKDASKSEYVVLGPDEPPPDYHGIHHAPGPNYGVPMHDLVHMDNGDQLLPEDIYTHPEYYGTGEDKADRESFAAAYAVKGRPKAAVRVYRGVPKDTTKIHPGDWVTPSRTYAKQHVESNVPNGHVISTVARARHLYTNGDSINEWGWHPPASTRVAASSSMEQRDWAKYNLEHPYIPHPRKRATITKEYTDQGEVGNHTHLTRKVYGTLPIERVKSMFGAMGEKPGAHRNMHGQQWEDFKADIHKNGIQHPIFITQDYNKDPKLSEGNHRRDAAVELGMDTVPVEVNYFGHAERQDRLFHDAEPIPAVENLSRRRDIVAAGIANGGFTWNTRTGEQPKTGYVVAVQGHSSIVPLTDPENVGQRDRIAQELVRYVKENKQLFADNPRLHLGGWYDEEHHEFVLDPTEVVADKEEAVRLGKQRNQQAIFDLAHGVELPTGGTGDRELVGAGTGERGDEEGRLRYGPETGTRSPPDRRDGRGAGGVGEVDGGSGPAPEEGRVVPSVSEVRGEWTEALHPRLHGKFVSKNVFRPATGKPTLEQQISRGLAKVTPKTDPLVAFARPPLPQREKSPEQKALDAETEEAKAATHVTASDGVWKAVAEDLGRMKIPEVKDPTFGFSREERHAADANRVELQQHGAAGRALVEIVRFWTGWGHGDMKGIKESGVDVAPLERAARMAPPSTVPLYRGITYGRFPDKRKTDLWESIRPGDIIPIETTSSFTTDKYHAKEFINEGETISPSRGVLMTLPPGHRALNIAPISNAPSEHEHVVAGSLRVKSAKKHDGNMLLEVEPV